MECPASAKRGGASARIRRAIAPILSSRMWLATVTGPSRHSAGTTGANIRGDDTSPGTSKIGIGFITARSPPFIASRSSALILWSALSRQRTCAVRCARLEGWPKLTVLASLVLRDAPRSQVYAGCVNLPAIAPQHEADRKYADFACESATSGFDACAGEGYVMRS